MFFSSLVPPKITLLMFAQVNLNLPLSAGPSEKKMNNNIIINVVISLLLKVSPLNWHDGMA